MNDENICALEGCSLPRKPKGKTAPQSRYCSVSHQGKARRLRDPDYNEKAKARNQRYCEVPENLEKRKESQKQWRKNNPDKVAATARKAGLKRRYGMSLEDYDALLEKQGGVCVICGADPKGRILDVDHNHETGEIRGLLCSSGIDAPGNCNGGLGFFQDNPGLLRRAADYLEGKL